MRNYARKQNCKPRAKHLEPQSQISPKSMIIAGTSLTFSRKGMIIAETSSTFSWLEYPKCWKKYDYSKDILNFLLIGVPEVRETCMTIAESSSSRKGVDDFLTAGTSSRSKITDLLTTGTSSIKEVNDFLIAGTSSSDNINDYLTTGTSSSKGLWWQMIILAMRKLRESACEPKGYSWVAGAGW